VNKNILATILFFIILVFILYQNFPKVLPNQRQEKFYPSNLFSIPDEKQSSIKTEEDIVELSFETLLSTENINSNSVNLGDTVLVHYRGFLAKDGFEFDSSLNPGKSPLRFVVGEGVIEGFSKGIIGMKVGEIRRIKIPSELAYGDKSVSLIPPNSDLIFDVELIKILK